MFSWSDNTLEGSSAGTFDTAAELTFVEDFPVLVKTMDQGNESNIDKLCEKVILRVNG